jgi:uncharacterized protein with von Willebrand factor type A (vWA) domain
LTLLVSVLLFAPSQANQKAVQSQVAQKALIHFAQERRKIEERYQTDLGKAVERLARRLDTAKKDRLKRGDLEDATRIDTALRDASKRPRTPKQLQEKLAGTRWTWRTTSGTGGLQISFGDGWYQLSDQKSRTPFVPSSGNQVMAQTKDGDKEAFSITFSDDLQMFMHRAAGTIRVGSRIK